MTELLLIMGSSAAIAEYTGTAGTLAINAETKTIHVFDGITKGGHPATGWGQPLIESLLANLDITSIAGLTEALDGKLGTARLGIAGGVATLDEEGYLAAENLPAYIDDVLDVADVASLPAVGSPGVFYIALAENSLWRWTGSTYIEIRAVPQSTDTLPEGETNRYITVERVQAAFSADGDLTYEDGVLSYTTPDLPTPDDLGLENVENFGIATEAQAIEGIATDVYMTPQRVAEFIASIGIYWNATANMWVWDEGAMDFQQDMEPLDGFVSSFDGDVIVPETILFYGTTEENDLLILDAGQVSVDTDKNTLRFHDGVTMGGFELPVA